MATEMSIKATGNKTEPQASVYFTLLTTLRTMGTGKTTSSTEVDRKHGLTIQTILDSTRRGRSTGWELSSGLTVRSTLVNSKTMISMALVFTSGPINEGTRATGSLIACTERASLSFLTGVDM